MSLPRISRGRMLQAAGVLAIPAITVLIASGAAQAAPQPDPQISAHNVASAWQFPAPGWTKADKEQGRVDDMLRAGNTIYIAGNFTESADHDGAVAARTYLAAEDAATGALTAWAPVLNGRVYALALSPDGTTLYAGGAFTTVNGQPHQRLVAFDVATGLVSPALPDPGFNGAVKAVAQVGGDLYAGGSFTQAGGHAHQRLARFTPGTGGTWQRDDSWTPSADQDVRDLIGDALNSRLIVAGWFTHLDGVKGQSHLAALSTSTGKPLPWGDHPSDPILDIARSGPRLYAAMAGPGGTAIADSIATGTRVWYYMADGNIQAVATVGGWPVFGMHGDNVAPHANLQLSEYGTSARIARHKVFELNPAGVLQPWAPALGSSQGVLGVWALRGSGGSLEVGGDFTTIDGAQQARFAIFPRLGG